MHKHDRIAEVDCAHDRAQHAHIGFRAGHDQTIGASFLEMPQQSGLRERRVAALVDHGGWRREPAQRGKQLKKFGIDVLPGRLPIRR